MIRFDESVVPGTSAGDLHYSLTQRFSREDTSKETLRKLRIVADDDDGTERLTLAGVLLCTPEPQRWLPHACIQAVSYAGQRTDTDYQTDARDIGGPLDEQVAEALHFVAAKHAGACDKEAGKVGAPAVQRASRVRGARECGCPPRLLDGGCADTPPLVRRPARALRSGCTGEHACPRTACIYGSPAATSSSCPCWPAVPPRQTSDAPT